MKISIFDLRKNVSNELLVQQIKDYFMETNEETELIIYNSIDTEIKDCQVFRKLVSRII